MDALGIENRNGVLQVACDGVMALEDVDFAHSLDQQDRMDVYGVVHRGLGWYVKFYIDEEVEGGETTVVSFHPPEHAQFPIICGGEVKMLPNSSVEHFKGLQFKIPGVAVPTCEECGEQFISPDKADEMQEALEEVHQKVLYREFLEAMERLKPHLPADTVARLLGYSQGYFSKLKRQQRHLTTHLVVLVKQLAMDPEPRLAELERMFARPVEATVDGEVAIADLKQDSEGELLGSG